MAQQVFVLWFGDEGSTNLAALNTQLGQRQVVMVSPMSGTGEQGGETPQSAFPYSRACVVTDDGALGQQAFVLWFGDEGATNLPALNARLNEKWRVVHMCAMSGTGEHGNDTPQSAFPYSRALFILQR